MISYISNSSILFFFARFKVKLYICLKIFIKFFDNKFFCQLIVFDNLTFLCMSIWQTLTKMCMSKFLDTIWILMRFFLKKKFFFDKFVVDKIWILPEIINFRVNRFNYVIRKYILFKTLLLFEYFLIIFEKLYQYFFF